jgi:hypothetical protein
MDLMVHAVNVVLKCHLILNGGIRVDFNVTSLPKNYSNWS